MPRLGIGIDRTQIREILELTPSERLARAVAIDQEHVEFRRALRMVAE
jgi:hypothetical protein